MLRSIGKRSRWAIVGLAAIGCALLLASIVDWLEIDLMNRVTGGELVTTDDLNASDTRQNISNLIYFAGLIFAAVFFLRWFHAAYLNLTSLGHASLRYKPGWAIGSWFVPFLNLVRPKHIANDIWNGSEPGALSYGGAGWDDVKAPQLLAFWWAAWIGSSFLSNIAARAWFDTKTPQDIRNADWLDLAANVVGIVGVVLAIVIVRRVTEHQAQRAQRLAAVA